MVENIDVIAEIQEHSTNKGKNLQWGLYITNIEILMERITKSELGPKIILKDEYLLFAKAGFDINLIPEISIIISEDNSDKQEREYKKIDKLIEHIDNIIKRDNFVARISVVNVINAQEINNTFSFTLKCIGQIEMYETEFTINVLYVNSGRKNCCHEKIKPFNDFVTLDSVYTYRIEKIVTEKITQILFGTSMIEDVRLIFDIYYIISRFCLNGNKLSEEISKVVKVLGSTKKIKKDYDTALEFINNKIMEDKWKHFVKDFGEKDNITYAYALDIIEKAFTQVVNAISKNIDFFGDWMPELKRYID